MKNTSCIRSRPGGCSPDSLDRRRMQAAPSLRAGLSDKLLCRPGLKPGRDQSDLREGRANRPAWAASTVGRVRCGLGPLRAASALAGAWRSGLKPHNGRKVVRLGTSPRHWRYATTRPLGNMSGLRNRGEEPGQRTTQSSLREVTFESDTITVGLSFRASSYQLRRICLPIVPKAAEAVPVLTVCQLGYTAFEADGSFDSWPECE